MKPKIAVIGLKGLPAFGGAAAVGENLIDQLKDRFDFTVYSVSSHTSLKTGEINGIKQIVFRNHGKGSLNTLVYYVKSLIHSLFHHYDLIHLHHAESGFITPLLRLRYKVIVTFHGIYNYKDPKFSGWHNWFFRFSERLNVKYANKVVSVSRPDQQYIINKYRRQILYIPNGITINDEMGKLISEKKTQGYIAFAAGRIYQIKGLHLLFTAAKKTGLQKEIKVAGDLEQVSDYKNEILNAATDLKVTFMGLIRNKQDLLMMVSAADFFVFPSLTEAMSMMLLEVVSMKTPVIASDIPSNKAIFTDDEVLFFKTNDSNDLMNKLQFAINNPEIMNKKANRAFEKLTANYTWVNIALQYNLLYQKLLK
jgi:glycosyltransferase involved in cell wall biosynthesis